MGPQGSAAYILSDVARLVTSPVPAPLEWVLGVIARHFAAQAIAFCAEDQAGQMAAWWCSLPSHGVPTWDEGSVDGTSLLAFPAERGTTWSSDDEVVFTRVFGAAFSQGAAVRLRRGAADGATVLAVGLPSGASFDDGQLQTLSIVAELVAEYPERLRVQAEGARHLEETRLLLELTRCSAGVVEPGEVLHRFCALLTREFRVDSCAVLLIDEGARRLRRAAAIGSCSIPQEISWELPGAPRKSDIEGAVRTASGEMRGDGRSVFPLESRDELLGALVLEGACGSARLDERARFVVEAAASQLALAVANARLVERLRRSCEELTSTRAEMMMRERLAAMGELSAMIAHEVRNPLAAIFNAVYRLQALIPKSTEMTTLMRIIEEEGQRLDHLTSELLDYARPSDVALASEEVRPILEEALEAAWVADGRRPEIGFEVQTATDVGAVQLDRRLMRQALVNLAVNAMQAMPAGGRVTALVRTAIRNGSPSLQVEVRDHGRGIADAHLSRIFEPFFTTRARGTGLGLAVVKRIIERHGGEIRVETSPTGTGFVVTLPTGHPTPDAPGRSSRV